MFNSTGPHFCTVCDPEYRKTIRVGVQLGLVEHNYSGTGVDIARCPKCGNYFQVTYTVDKIDLLNREDWE